MSKRKGKGFSKERLQGLYANHYRVGHNAYEFVIDFGQWYEGDAQARFHTRITTSPRYAKELCDLLLQSLQAYERSFGAIGDHDQAPEK